MPQYKLEKIMIKKILRYLDLDEYDQKAVCEPAILNLVLFYFVLVCCICSQGLKSVTIITAIEAAVPFIVLAIAIRFLMNFFRNFSKAVMQYPRYKRNMSNMPTTELLLWSNDEMPKVEKKNIRNKILVKYGVELLSEKAEKKDEKTARQLIADVVSRIRADIRNNKNTDKMYLHYNIQYGSSRNFFGGGLLCISAELLVILLFTFFSIVSPLAWIIFALHSLFVIVCFFMIPARAKEYASFIYTEFLRLY